HRHLWRNGLCRHATHAGDRHSDGTRCERTGCAEDGGRIRNVPGCDRCGRGTDRRVCADTIDGESLVWRLADRSYDLRISDGGSTDCRSTRLLHPGAARNESRSTRGVALRVSCFLCGPLRIYAYSAVNGDFNAEYAEIRRGPQRQPPPSITERQSIFA